MEAEACCTTDIRKAESHCVEHACSIQQAHAEDMQLLEKEAMEVEGRDCLSFLATCGIALQTCPPEAHGVLMGPLQLLTGNMSQATLLNIPPLVPPLGKNLPLWFPILHLQQHLGPPQGSNNDTLCLTRWSPHHGQEMKSWGLEELPCLRWKDETPFNKSLKGSWWEAFAKGSDLLWQAREDYFKTNHPHFDQVTSHDLSDVFWDMILHVSLLDSQIYKIQEAWTGWDDLQYANDALKTSPKGLYFFHPVSPLELAKVMGLTGIHNPEALCCFAGVTFYPWCGKEGQNEGTIVNHLWTMHYKLGLVCKKCLCCTSITSEGTCHHGQSCKQPQEEDRGLDDTSSSVYPTLTIPVEMAAVGELPDNPSYLTGMHINFLVISTIH